MSKHSRLAAVFGLLLLATLALVLLRDPQATVAPDGADQPGATMPRAQPITGTAAATERAPASQPGTLSPAGRQEVATPAPQPADDDAADPPLQIVVCDAGDQPVADVPVGLRLNDAAHAPVFWQQRTRAPDGSARVPRPRALLRAHGDAGVAALMLPLRGSKTVALRSDALPTEPVKLRLPATGQVVVWIDDLPAADADTLTVTLTAARDQGLDSEFVAELTGKPSGSAARFPFVGLSLLLVVRAQRPGQSEDTHTIATGPVAAGETVEVHLRGLPPPQRTVLVLHLVDAKNQPLPSRLIDIVLEAHAAGSSQSSSMDLDTDKDGVLRLVLDDSFRTMPERSLRLRSRPTAKPAGDPDAAGEAMVTLPAALLPGDNDLGTVPLLPAPLVCAGTVVDQQDAPVAGARLDVFASSTRAAASPSGPDMTVQVRGLSGRSDATGHFVLRGNAPAGELTLSIDAAGHLPAKTPFLLGAENLRVQLASAASLAGSVRLDDVVTASDVIVELISGKDSEQERVTVRGQLGEFTFASLPPGNATAKVHVLGETDSGLVVADLPLRAGEVTRDPRLQNVDLSAGRRAVHFTVVDQAGRPVPEARVAVLTGPGQNTFEGYMLTAGQGRIVTRVASLAVLVFAAGYRSVAVTDLADGAAITLPPPLAVRLQLPAESPLPPPPFALTARFTRDDSGWPSQTNFRFYSGLNNSYSGDGSPPWVQPVTAVCGADGSALVQVTEPGTYGLNWRLSRHSPGDRTDRWLANDPPTIRVQDVAGEQSVRAGPTAEQLAAARARLGDAR